MNNEQWTINNEQLWSYDHADNELRAAETAFPAFITRRPVHDIVSSISFRLFRCQNRFSLYEQARSAINNEQLTMNNELRAAPNAFPRTKEARSAINNEQLIIKNELRAAEIAFPVLKEAQFSTKLRFPIPT